MSRAVLMIALYESLGRLPTPDERTRFLAAMKAQAAGERIYIAHRVMTCQEAEPEIRRLHDEGWSVRRIAGAVGWSKSRVQQILSVQLPALKVDSAA